MWYDNTEGSVVKLDVVSSCVHNQKILGPSVLQINTGVNLVGGVNLNSPGVYNS